VRQLASQHCTYVPARRTARFAWDIVEPAGDTRRDGDTAAADLRRVAVAVGGAAGVVVSLAEVGAHVDLPDGLVAMVAHEGPTVVLAVVAARVYGEALEVGGMAGSGRGRVVSHVKIRIPYVVLNFFLNIFFFHCIF
jgi:hypothetical protein